MKSAGQSLLREVSSGSKSTELIARRAENSISGWGCLWERSPVGSRFSRSLFRDASGTVSESVRACGFKRNSSNLERGLKIRDSVLSNSWDSFLVTLPSISSETCVIYSSVTPGVDAFCEWLFLECWSVSQETAANFPLLLNVAIPCRGKNSAVVKTEIPVIFVNDFSNETKCNFVK